MSSFRGRAARLAFGIGLGLAFAASARAGVRGQVVTQDGSPVSGAVVTAYPQETDEAVNDRLVQKRARTALASTATGADGQFALSTPGALLDLEVRAAGFCPTGAVGIEGRSVAVRLEPAPNRQGRVLADGKPLAGVTLAWFSGRAGGPRAELLLVSDAQGRFELPDPTKWANAMLALHPDFAPLQRSEGAWPGDLAFTLEPGVALSGQVKDTRGQGVPGVAIRVDGSALARSRKDGRFSVAHTPASWRILSVQDGGQVGTARKTLSPVTIEVRSAHRLAGSVKDADTGEPLAGALVQVGSQDTEQWWQALSDSRGLYAFPHLAAGRYHLYAGRPGYAPTQDQAKSDPNLFQVDLRSDDALERALVLEARRLARGRVLDEKGSPAAGVSVFATLASLPNLYFQPLDEQLGSRVLSGRDGRFELELSEALSDSEGFLSGDESAGSSALQAVAPGRAAARSAALPLEGPVPPVELRLTPGTVLKGRVTDPEGRPLAGISVDLAEDGVAFGAPMAFFLGNPSLKTGGFVKTDSAGRFAVSVHKKSHVVSLRGKGWLRSTVNVKSPEQAFEQTLQPSAELSGVALKGDGTPAADALVMANAGLESAQAKADAQGAFSFDSLPVGSFEVQAWLERQQSVKQRVRTPASGVRLEFKATGRVQGRVVEAGSSEAVTQFTLSTRSTSKGDFSSSRSDEVADPEGRFSIPDLPQGPIEISVQSPGHVAATAQATVSHPGEGDQDEVEIALERSAEVSGKVSSPDGSPVEEAGVSAFVGNRSVASAETSDDGRFSLEGIAPGPIELRVFKTGFLSARRSLDAATGARIEILLARGLSLSGVVVSEDGVGWPEASVSASSAAVDAAEQQAETDASGRFRLTGLAPGRYTLTASLEDGGEASLSDVDVEQARNLRLVVSRSRTAVLTGKVMGLGESEAGMRMVIAEGEKGASKRAPVEASGRFRMTDAPVGEVRVRAMAASLEGVSRSSRVRHLTLAAGTETEIELTFSDEIGISGHVSKDGDSLPGAMVSFDGPVQVMGRTDAEGAYQVVGLEPGSYGVAVYGSARYSTRLEVTGTAVFDIDATTHSLRGLVIDEADRSPLLDVQVSVWKLEPGARSTPAATESTSATGEFLLNDLVAGRYRLLTSKQGYGQEMRELEAGGEDQAELEIALSLAEGVSARVVDARTDQALDATVVVRDRENRIIANRHTGIDDQGRLSIALSAGAYKLSSSATGYATTTVPVQAPSLDLKVGLTPGGNLVIESERELSGTVRLLRPDGDEYVRCWCNGIAEISVKGRKTTIANVAPGSYTVELEEAGSAPQSVGTVEIAEGSSATLGVR